MRNSGIIIERSTIEHVPGGFITFGPGTDIDQALDAAVTVERFELGTNGLVPSLADVDPAAERLVRDGIVHPYRAIEMLLRAAETIEPGVVMAQAVAPLTAFKHERRRIVLESVGHHYPATTGLILPLSSSLRDEIEGTLAEHERAGLVGVELVAAPRRRFKVAAQPVRGPRQTRFAIFDGERVVEIHPNQSAARKAAVARAKAAGDVIELHVRPYVGRNEGEPFVVVRRHLVAQRATLKAVLATVKNPERVRCAGWVFAGRLAR